MPDPLRLGTLGFGAANLGNLYREVSDEQAAEVLEAAWDVGIRYFDTAPHYGLGLSERRLGAFLRTKPRDEYVVSTKAGRLLRPNPDYAGELDLANDFAVPATLRREWDLSEAGIRASLEESLERLGLDTVDILYLHDPDHSDDPDDAPRTAYPALAALREEGLVRSVGVGSMSTEALLTAARSEHLDILMIAGRLTLAEQPVLAEVLPAAVQNSLDVVAAGVFNSGILATAVPAKDARYEYGDVPPALLERVAAIAAICAEHGVELPTAALQYPLRLEPVVNVLFGSGRPEQVRQNAERMAEPIPEALWEALAEARLIPWR